MSREREVGGISREWERKNYETVNHNVRWGEVSIQVEQTLLSFTSAAKVAFYSFKKTIGKKFVFFLLKNSSWLWNF